MARRSSRRRPTPRQSCGRLPGAASCRLPPGRAGRWRGAQTVGEVTGLRDLSGRGSDRRRDDDRGQAQAALPRFRPRWESAEMRTASIQAIGGAGRGSGRSASDYTPTSAHSWPSWSLQAVRSVQRASPALRRWRARPRSAASARCRCSRRTGPGRRAGDRPPISSCRTPRRARTAEPGPPQSPVGWSNPPLIDARLPFAALGALTAHRPLW